MTQIRDASRIWARRAGCSPIGARTRRWPAAPEAGNLPPTSAARRATNPIWRPGWPVAQVLG